MRKQFEVESRPQARYATGADPYNEVQLAALNVSPIDQKLLQVQEEALQVSKEVADSLERQLRPALTH